ncbi:MAG TPA: hypothetical protein VKB80_18750 [Kofleriaceae bacterium]|nr:hypothetical protein [Kofleriaceae bacterium]
MRGSGAALFGAAVALLAAEAIAAADPPAIATGKRPVQRLPDEVDITRVKPDMVVLHDGHGHYLALVALREMDMTFYGDGRTFNQLRVLSTFSDSKVGNSMRRFWSPISTDADIILDTGGNWTVRCSDRTTPMVPLAAAQKGEVLSAARFLRPFWKRQALGLARDDRGVYYYVDMIRDDRGPMERASDANPPRGYRLYVGRKGRMKEQRLTDAVEDSGGLVLSTRGGDLSIQTEAKAAVFSTGKRQRPLVYLPLEDNLLLIYRDLGLYGKLGVPCDDL